MPICTREGLDIKPTCTDDFKDDEEVFYCETTKEIFRDYEEYFRRIMLINATIWACESTGKDNLTYAEALKSERKARKLLNAFKEQLRAPTLIVVKTAQQGCYRSLFNLTYQFLKDRFFLKETVVAAKPNKSTYHECDIVEIVTPKTAPADGIYDPATLMYRVRKTSSTSSHDTWVTSPNYIRRRRSDFQHEFLQFFIKENVRRVDGILEPKEAPYKKYVTNAGVTMETFFVGKMPDWKPSKRKSEIEKKQGTLNKFLIKKEDDGQSISEPLEQGELEKRVQERLDQINKEAEEKKRKAHERREFVQQLYANYASKLDDLERNDQQLLPLYKPLKSIIHSKLFSDFMAIYEFLTTFSPNIEHPLSKTKMNYNELCRAFTVREVAGPLSEILRILLNIIFALQCDEEQECAVKYITIPAKQEPLHTMNNATKTHHHVTKYFFKKLNALPLEPAFASEILRLHLLASGAHTDEKSERWRLFYRSGYSASEDPGLALRMQQPHILRALKVHSVYELPFSDIMKILNCLICQILSYNGLLTIIAERKNLLHDVRFNLRKLYASENKRHFNLQSEKRKIVEDYAIHSGEARDEEKRKKLEIMMNKNVQKIQQKDENEKQKFNDGLENLQKELASLVSYLGSDRAYRNYYIFNSMKGVFIEHLPNSLDTCLTDPPVNNIQLAHCARNKKEVINLLTKQLIKEEEKELVNNTVQVEEQNGNNTEVANGSAVIVNGNATEPLVNGNDESDKENQSSITNGDIEKEKTEKNINGEISKINGISNAKANDKSSLYSPSPYELFMCTGDPNHCIVHDNKNTDRVRWSYISEEKDIESLINGLNPMGIREGPLKEQLINLKEALFDHVHNCQKNYFSVEESQRDNYIKTIISDTNKKYKSSNLGHINNDISEVLYYTCIDEILTLESGITEGNLGKLKVKDIAQWRADLQNHTYNSQRPQLTYGVKDEEEFEDPGKTLGDTIKYEMEDDTDEEIPLHNSSDVVKNVQSLASAILQIEQGIDQKFLKEPFGLKTEPKDEKEKEAKLAAVRKNRQYWETSLMSSTSYAQLFLHMRILIESVMWYKSSVNSKCIVCKKKSDADKMLLCDECNAGTHLYCMEPKLKAIPAGDWYCKNCIIHIKRINPTAAHKKPRKQTIIEDNLEDSDASDEYLPQKAYQKKKKRKGGAKPLCLLSSDNESKDDDDDDESFHAEEESNDEDVKLTKIAKKTRYAKLREEAQIQEKEDNKDEETENEETENDDNDDEQNENEVESDEKEEDNAVESDSDSDSMDKPLINAKPTQNEIEKRHHTEVNYEDSIEEESDDEDKICCICKCDCSEILCRTCTSWYHLECTNLTKKPRGRWMCHKCKAKKERKRKVDSEDEESDEEFSSYAKKPRRSGRSASTPREDPPKKGSRRGRRNEELPLDSVVLYQLLDDIMKHAYAWPFLRPIVKREVPDYYTIIKSPMDFAKVKSKLNMAQYTMNEELLSDIALIFKNCDIYNSRGNDIHRAGASLEKFIVDRCKELNLPYNPSGLQADADYVEET